MKLTKLFQKSADCGMRLGVGGQYGRTAARMDLEKFICLPIAEETQMYTPFNVAKHHFALILATIKLV